MKKIIFSAILLFINTFSLLSKDADTVIITVNDLFETRKIVFEVREGQVILLIINSEERFYQTKISLSFWRGKKQANLPRADAQERVPGEEYQLHSKGKIIFGKKTANEDKYIISPVTGLVEIRLKRYGLKIGMLTAVAMIVFSKIFFF